jgi:two-component system NarL family response regulator
MPKKPAIRVLIADDHFVVAHGLAAVLTSQNDIAVVGTARNGEEAVKLFAKHKPDVLMLDLRMPKMDGVTVVQQLMTKHKPCRIIIMTTYSGEEEVKQCIKNGALGYLLKDTSGPDIIYAVREVSQGKRVLPKELAEKLALSLSQPTLTSRESEVLQLLAAGRSNKDIATALSIRESTIKCHVTAILTKLDALSRTEAIAIAIQRGLIKS